MLCGTAGVLLFKAVQLKLSSRADVPFHSFAPFDGVFGIWKLTTYHFVIIGKRILPSQMNVRIINLTYIVHRVMAGAHSGRVPPINC